MPPRKRARQTMSASTPDPATSPAKASLASTPSSPTASDAWTTEQQIALFKLLINHKPTGMHKHMAMLSIYTSLQHQGHTHAAAAQAKAHPLPREHMRIPRIWEKLASLYDLDALDEREDQHRLQEDEDAAAAAAAADNTDGDAPARQIKWHAAPEGSDEPPWAEFSLDRARDADDASEFAERMFARRLKGASEPPSSPSAVPDAPREASSVPSRRGRGGGRGGRGRGRGSRGGARRGSRATTSTGDDLEMRDVPDEEDNGDGEEDDEDEDGGDDDDEVDDSQDGDEDDGEDDEEEEAGTSTRSTRGSTRTAHMRAGRRKR